MKLHTLLIAGVASVVLSGAALAAGASNVSIQQTSAGGQGSSNRATINMSGSGTQSGYISQHGANTQSATLNANSRRGDAIGTISQTGGRNNNANMTLTAPRGVADGIIVQDASRSNRANVNLTGGRGVVFDSFQNATGRFSSNSLRGDVRSGGPVTFNAAQSVGPRGTNFANVRVR